MVSQDKLYCRGSILGLFHWVALLGRHVARWVDTLFVWYLTTFFQVGPRLTKNFGLRWCRLLLGKYPFPLWFRPRVYPGLSSAWFISISLESLRKGIGRDYLDQIPIYPVDKNLL